MSEFREGDIVQDWVETGKYLEVGGGRTASTILVDDCDTIYEIPVSRLRLVCAKQDRQDIAPEGYTPVYERNQAGWWWVSFPDFPGCITCGESIHALRRSAASVLAFHVAGMKKDGLPIPAPYTGADVVVPNE